MYSKHLSTYREKMIQKHVPRIEKLEADIIKTQKLLVEMFDDFLSYADLITAKGLRKEYQQQRQKALEAEQELRRYY